MVDRRTAKPHQLLGATGSNPSSKDLRQEDDRSVHPLAPRQLDSSGLHKQSGWNSVERVNHSHKKFMGVVSGTQHTNHSPAPPRILEQHCGRRESHPQGPLRLDVAPTRVQQDKPLIRTTGPICIEANYPAASLLQLETRPPGQSHGRSGPGLVHDKGIRQPTMDPSGPSTGSGSSVACASDTSGTSLEDTAMVLRPATHVGRSSTANTPLTLDQRPGSSPIEPLPQLAVWHISGRSTLVNNYQRRLQTLCSSHGVRKPTNLTTHSSTSGVAGVLNGVQIPFLVL